MPNRLSNSLRSMVSLDSSVSLPAETEVEYEPVTVTVTSPLPETTVLPFATMVTVLPSLPEATLSAEMVVSFATPPTWTCRRHSQ